MKPENSTISQPVQEGVQSPAHHPLMQPAVIISPVVCTSEHGNYPTLNPKFTALSTPCPHCQQTSLETAWQPPMIPGKQGYNITHCKNPQCHHYGLTMRHERFMEGK